MILYTMHVPVCGEKDLRLEFRDSYTKTNFSGGMDGYTYTLGGRTYRDVESLWLEPTEPLCKNVQITTDTYGQRVLMTCTQIPTFDSGDREWDSKELEFLFFDGKHIHLVLMRGGYRIAKLTFWEELTAADIRIQPVFEKLGWPTEGIRWIR